MNRTEICFALFYLIIANVSVAQDAMVFGGRGIRSNNDDQNDSAQEVNRWPSLLDFSNDKEPEENRFQMFGRKQRKDLIRPTPFRQPEAEAEPDSDHPLFGGMSAWIPKRDPDTPGFFRQMNSKSKDAFDRTADWAHRQNENLRSKTFETWDAITGGRDRTSKTESRDRQQNFGARPPVHSAENLDSKPKVRF